jgi:acetyl-CoA acyltransferase
MTQAVIVAYSRSPFTPAFKGQLAKTRPDEIISQVIKGMLSKLSIDSSEIEDLILGCAFPEGEQGLNMARLVSFLSDLPICVAGQTVNRFCGSSMQSIHIAVTNILSGYGQAYIAAGVESMTRVPMTGFNPLPHPGLFQNFPQAYESMGITAENLVDKYKINRKTQDEFALLSHKKAAIAAENGFLSEEIIPIKDKDLTIIDDGCIRPDSNLDALAGLNPAFKAKGSVTAGNSSPITDGASAVLVCNDQYAKNNSLEVLAKVKSCAVAGCDPKIMGIGPVPAMKKALDRAGLTLKDIDVIELNEAFAAQALSVIKEAGINIEIVNIDGGAIALGHPLGASGARIVGKAAHILRRENKKYALATMCIGGGQGIATILEAV